MLSLITGAASFLTGGVSKYVGYGVLAAGLLGSLAVAKHEYDAGIAAQVTNQIAAKQAADDLATVKADNARTVAALTARAAQAEAEAATAATLKGAIANAKPSSFSCIRSAAGRITLNGMRHAGRASGH